MKASMRRIWAMFVRYIYLHKRSLPRIFDIIFWPVMGLLVWGFVTTYIQSVAQNTLSRTIIFLINGMIFWDILYRGQLSVSVSIAEEVSHQNILNILVSPLRIWEWILATFIYALAKTILITILLSSIALTCYRFDMAKSLGLYLFPPAGNLFLFACSVGIITSAMLFRWGHAAEAMIWGVPFLIQPISAVYYPVSVLPHWLQIISKCLPSTYVFEGMRAVLRGENIGYGPFFSALGLNIIFFILATLFCNWFYKTALNTGRLVRMGMD